MITFSHEELAILLGFCCYAGIAGWIVGHDMGRLDERAETLREMLKSTSKPTKREASDCPECRIS